MNPALVALGVALCLAALLLLVFVVFRPRHGRISKALLVSSQQGAGPGQTDKRL